MCPLWFSFPRFTQGLWSSCRSLKSSSTSSGWEWKTSTTPTWWQETWVREPQKPSHQPLVLLTLPVSSVSSVIEDKWCMEGANNCQSIMLIKIKPFPLNVLNSNANSLILFQLGKEESVFGFSYVYCSLLWFSFSKTKSFGPLPDCFFIYVHKVGPLKDKAWLVHFPINLPCRWKEFSAKCRLAHEYWSPFHSFEQNQS